MPHDRILGIRNKNCEVKATDEKIKAVKNFRRLQYKDVLFYAGIIADLFPILQKGWKHYRQAQKVKQCRWGGDQEKAFQDMKKCFTTAPVCRIFDPDLETVVTTNASEEAIRSVLERVDKITGLYHPVELFSRRFDTQHKKWSTREQET